MKHFTVQLSEHEISYTPTKRHWKKKENRLSDYTPEEDFLPGTMLGYDMVKQCDRYLSLKARQKSLADENAA